MPKAKPVPVESNGISTSNGPVPLMSATCRDLDRLLTVPPPATVRILGRRFTIEWPETIDEDSHTFGQANTRHSTIKVSATLAPDEAKETALHEALHPLLSFSGIELSEAKHGVFATAIFTFVRDNPEFMRWIMDET